jgi:hypothetical protein
MTSLESAPRRSRGGADLPIWLPVGIRGRPSSAELAARSMLRDLRSAQARCIAHFGLSCSLSTGPGGLTGQTGAAWVAGGDVSGGLTGRRCGPVCASWSAVHW